MGRILALDFGSKTIGVALTDPLKIIAVPLETLRREKSGKLRPSLRRITELSKENDVELVILGYPLNMDDTRGESAHRVEEFKLKLENRLFHAGIEVPVVLWDERLSSVEADELLGKASLPHKDRKQYIDSIEAAIILKDYLSNGLHRSTD